MMSNTQTLLEGLNEQQQEAVLKTQGPLLIIAGAGSGKTSVLTRRIGYLIEAKRVAPWCILAITFTNKAAAEMRERVEKLVGPYAKDIWVATFHATCVRILRRDIDKLGYDKGFTILDGSDQVTAIKRSLAAQNVDAKKFEPRAVLAQISHYKNMLTSPAKAQDQAQNPYEAQIAKLYEDYQKRLRAQNSLDFDDLIVKTVQLLESDPTVRAFYHAKFQYILVDEYQDTNHSQYRLVKLLTSEANNLCVVGDSDQSIYRWRGADIGNILSFEEDFPDAKVILLEQNYRSTQTVLDAANAVIEHNEGRPKKNLWTQNDQGTPIRVYQAYNEQDEARYIVSEIVRKTKEEGIALDDVAILYRANAQSRALEEAFLLSGVNYRVFGGIKFYERKEIKDLLSYLRLLVNPDDDLSFARVINVPKRGIGATTVEKITGIANLTGRSMFSVILDDAHKQVISRSLKGIQEFVSLYDRFVAQIPYLSVAELIEQVITQSGYERMLLAEDSIEAQTRLENMQELISVAKEYEKRDPEGGLLGFLSDVALVADAEQEGGNHEGVTLMTLHSAKGLEFPIVFLPGMEEGVFPHQRSLAEASELEEERRLCYVGITRAKKELYLTRASMRTLFGRFNNNLASRFLDEIPAHLLEDTKKPTPVIAPRKESRTGESLNQIPPGFGGDLSVSWQVGDKATHRKWGDGVVLSCFGEGEDLELTIEFEAPIGARRLLVKFAPIRKVEDDHEPSGV